MNIKRNCILKDVTSRRVLCERNKDSVYICRKGTHLFMTDKEKTVKSCE